MQYSHDNILSCSRPKIVPDIIAADTCRLKPSAYFTPTGHPDVGTRTAGAPDGASGALLIRAVPKDTWGLEHRKHLLNHMKQLGYSEGHWCHFAEF